MRIISQDGLYDVPYEALAIRFHENDGTIILGVPLSVVSMDLVSDVPLITLGIYSTEAKAKKAMEMLRAAYAGKFVTNADISEDFNERLNELMKGGFGTVVVKETNDCRVELNNLNGYFQFPADEDVEE